MIKIGIILGSTRPGRNGEAVAKWVYEIAKKRTDAEFELVDLKDRVAPAPGRAHPPFGREVQQGPHQGVGRQGRLLRRLCVRDRRVPITASRPH